MATIMQKIKDIEDEVRRRLHAAHQTGSCDLINLFNGLFKTLYQDV